MLPTKIISGGQTGVDRAALDVAIELGLPHGGWCPRGRLAEDGRIPAKYELTELASSDYAARTEQNVLDSSGTLILYVGRLARGTELTSKLALRHRKPLCPINLEGEPNLAAARRWLALHAIEILNVAGPRESSRAGIYELAQAFLRRLLVADRRPEAERRAPRSVAL